MAKNTSVINFGTDLNNYNITNRATKGFNLANFIAQLIVQLFDFFPF